MGIDGMALHTDILDTALHIGLYGTSGAGKDNLLRCWFLALTNRNLPDKVQFVFLDGKGDWLTPNLAMVAHMFLPPAGGYGKAGDERILEAVRMIDREAERRHNIIKAAGCRSREAYNKQGGNLPLLVVVATDVMTSVSGDVETLLVSLVSKARSLGIRVIVSMQTPTGKSTQWRMNLSTVVTGALQSGSQDTPALGIDVKDMLWRPSRLPDPKKNPGIFVVRRGAQQDIVKAPYISDSDFDAAVALLPRSVSVSKENKGDLGSVSPRVPQRDTACTSDTNGEYSALQRDTACTSDSVNDTRAEVIRRAAEAGLSRKDIALLVGGNYNKAYQQVKGVLDNQECKT
jgi:hypothetical protein